MTLNVWNFRHSNNNININNNSNNNINITTAKSSIITTFPKTPAAAATT